MLSCPTMIFKQICKRVQNFLLQLLRDTFPSPSDQQIYLFRTPSKKDNQQSSRLLTSFGLDPGHRSDDGLDLGRN